MQRVLLLQTQASPMEFFPQIVLWIAFLIPLVVFIPFNYKGYFNLFTTLLLSGAGLVFSTRIFLHGEVEYPMFDLPFIGNIRVEADLLSAVLALSVRGVPKKETPNILA